MWVYREPSTLIRTTQHTRVSSLLISPTCHTCAPPRVFNPHLTHTPGQICPYGPCLSCPRPANLPAPRYRLTGSPSNSNNLVLTHEGDAVTERDEDQLARSHLPRAGVKRSSSSPGAAAEVTPGRGGWDFIRRGSILTRGHQSIVGMSEGESASLPPPSV